MLIDARLLPVGCRLGAEAVVVGAGPAGITLASTLAAAGRTVVLLDAGGRHHSRRDDDALRGQGSGRPMPLVASRRRGFGGTSGHWTEETGLRIRPLDDIDLEPSPARPGVSWPVTRSELEPFYRRAHEAVGRSSGYEPARWGLDASSTPLTWNGGPELAMFQFARADCFTSRYDELVAHPRVDVVLHAQVCRLDLDETGARIASAAVARPAGDELVVVGTTFVVATGALETSRLLLASPGRDGQGLGNEHGNVGRYFMDRLSCDTGIVVPAAGVDPNLALFGERRVADDESQPMLWLGAERIRRHGMLNGAFWLYPWDRRYLAPGVTAARSLRQALRSTPRRDLGHHARQAVRGVIDVARYGAARFHRRDHAAEPRIALRFLGEQAPHRDSRITLSERVDALGMRRLHLHWRVDDEDVHSVRRHQDLLASLLEERGVATIVERFDEATERPMMSNFHHLGGTRMHPDARQGVVDVDCRVHGVRNLFLVGGSVFPAGGYVNPTLTIIALALRCADCVGSELVPARLSAAAPGASPS